MTDFFSVSFSSLLSLTHSSLCPLRCRAVHHIIHLPAGRSSLFGFPLFQGMRIMLPLLWVAVAKMMWETVVFLVVIFPSRPRASVSLVKSRWKSCARNTRLLSRRSPGWQVPTPALAWTSCHFTAYCTSPLLPRDAGMAAHSSIEHFTTDFTDS